MGHYPPPIVFESSKRWHGNDGKWSTFEIRVGEPPQHFYVLPTSATGETILPGHLGCPTNSTTPRDCGAQRGVQDINGRPSPGYQTSWSKTWKPMAQSQYHLDLETRLGIDIPASFGLDQAGLMAQNPGKATLLQQVVGTISGNNFFVGLFGLSSRESNFTDSDLFVPSYVSNLKKEKMIPSLSYGYTAGAYYKIPQAYGSLTLGGYDISRIVENDVIFPFDGSEDRSISLKLWQIQSQERNGTVDLLKEELYVQIDYTVSHFWLPLEICEAFTSTFELRYENTTKLYLVDDDVHQRLLARNPNITFTIGSSLDSTKRVSIILPYKSFDLQASWPIYDNATNYFPIRQGNATQWTLGRAFLQEAYLVVDYERSVFKVHQAKLHAPNDRSIIPIYDKSYSPESDLRLSAGATAGIVVGAVVFVSICISTCCILIRRGKRSKHPLHKAETESGLSDSDSHLKGLSEKDGSNIGKAELCAPNGTELEGHSKVELPCEPVELAIERER